MTDRAVWLEIDNYCQDNYNISRELFTYQLGLKYGYLGNKYRYAISYWDEIQRDLYEHDFITSQTKFKEIYNDF